VTEEWIRIMPTLIRRTRGEHIELLSVPAGEPEGSERALLVFMDEDQAEAFRAETGVYPASQGYVAEATDLEDIKAMLRAGDLTLVALRGPEPKAVSVLDADTFCEMLEPVGTPREG
jgi:hypothetical protein